MLLKTNVLKTILEQVETLLKLSLNNLKNLKKQLFAQKELADL